MSRIGIFPGTFDPIHDGHIGFAREAITKCGLAKVWFMVEPTPRRKQGIKAFEHRARMAQLAIAQEKQMGSIILEQQRFTVHDTLPVLANRFGGDSLSLLIGEDVLSHLTHWPHVNELIDSVEFIIGVRKAKEDTIIDTVKSIEKTRGHPFRSRIVHTFNTDVSSSQVRKAVRAGGPVHGIHPAVARYVSKHQLYAAVTNIKGDTDDA